MISTATSIPVPTLPASIVELLAVGSNDPAYYERVVRVAGRDPGLATTAIHLANSSAFGGQATSTTLEQSILRLGARRFVSLVVSAHLVQIFVPASLEMQKLWRHSIATSVAARSVARLWPQLAVPPEQGALAGLIHNLGAMVLAVHHLEPYRNLLAKHDLDDDGILDAERSLFGGDHQQIGRAAAEKMGLPADLVEVVRHHHRVSEVPLRLLALIRLSAATMALHAARIQNSGAVDALERLRELASSYRFALPDEQTLNGVLAIIDDEIQPELDRLGVAVF